tara:strand:- start:56 stop:430 length:375 start_codon:yes stop_codon:yes gene_type:complete
MSDMLSDMFKLRTQFMQAIKEKYPSSYPDWPVDVSKKRSQKALRETALKGVEEMFEALQHLKNWKTHKQTGDRTFEREEFLEEMVDAFNYFFAMLVMIGVTPEELFAAYEEKNKKIHSRLTGKY